MADARDRQIYLQVRGCGSRKCFWYVIEDKPTQQEKGHQGTVVPLVCESGSSTCMIITQLHFPELDDFYEFSSLVVLKDMIFVIGGEAESESGERLPLKGFFTYDLSFPKDYWRKFSGLVPGRQHGAVAFRKNLLTVGQKMYNIQYPRGHSRKLPAIPGLELGEVHMLGAAQNKLFVYTTTTGQCGANTLYSLHLHTSEWTVVDDNFWGDWSPGVAAFGGSYLFSFGTQDPKRPPAEDSASGVYAFDVTRGEWLPTPVEGLEIIDPHPYLLQISKPEDSKLALVTHRECCDDFRIPTSRYCEVHCSKFILHRCIGTGTVSFSASLLSKVVARLDDTTTTVLNCTSAMGYFPSSVITSASS